MAGVEVVTHAWKEWGLQALLLLSFAVQVTLVILAEFRRYIDSGVLSVFVWSAYMLADATAIYVLGHLSLTSRSPEHQLLALWAPFLLLHLGGQDNITAYAIEDNRLWLRHLQTLVVQVAAAAYVIYGSSIIVGDSRSLLLPATILVFLVGVVKYGERVWALRCAADSSRTGNYQSGILSSTVSTNLVVPEPFTSGSDPEAFLLKAHLQLNFAKVLTVGRSLSQAIDVYSIRSRLHGEDLYKMVEMQLSLMHDVFYTKAEVTHTWYGLCIRILSSLTIAVAFLLFNILLLGDHHRKLNGYSRVDVLVTYVLFVGAVVLETTSLLRAMFSSWTCALLVKCSADWKTPEGITVCTFLARALLYLRRLVRAADWRRCSWSRSMGQQNLLQLCRRSRASRSSRIARWMGVEDWWNTMAYSWSIPVSACIKQLLLKSMKARQWGREALERRGLYDERQWTVGAIEPKLEERILIWHIATEVYLWWYKYQEQAEAGGGDRGRLADLVEAAQALSNYMVFLLAARPHMLPPDASRDAYVTLCYALTRDARHPDLRRFTSPTQMLPRDASREDVLSSLRSYADTLTSSWRTKQLLEGGCRVATSLIGRQDSPVGDTLEMICEVWAEMLCYVGDGCSTYAHAKQLSSGGELLTVAALVKKYITRQITYDSVDNNPK